LKRGCDVVNNHLNKDKDLMLVEGDSVAAVGSACSKCVLKQQKKTAFERYCIGGQLASRIMSAHV
jgi:hypothetical protein